MLSFSTFFSRFLYIVTSQERTGAAAFEFRADRLARLLLEVIGGAEIAASESLSIPRGVSGAIGQSIAWGAIAAAAAARGVPLYAVRPQVWEHACHGDGQGKGRVPYELVLARLTAYAARCSTPDARAALEAIPRGLRGHALDALGVALWARARAATAPTVQVMPPSPKKRPKKRPRRRRKRTGDAERV